MEPHDPWAVADKLDVAVAFTKLTKARGYTDGIGVVWLDERLSVVEIQCTLTHELIHIDMGHVGRKRPAEEAVVRERTARLLVDWADLTAAASLGLDPWEAAAWIGVTPEVLKDRYRYATCAELERLAHEGDHPHLGQLARPEGPYWRTE